MNQIARKTCLGRSKVTDGLIPRCLFFLLFLSVSHNARSSFAQGPFFFYSYLFPDLQLSVVGAFCYFRFSLNGLWLFAKSDGAGRRSTDAGG